MPPARAAAYLGGGVLLAAWLASAAGVTRQSQTTRMPRRSPDVVHLDTLASDVQSQAVRLRQRLAAAPAPQAPTRNPFVFASRDMPVRAAVTPRAEPRTSAAVPEPAAREPDLVLLGVAEQAGPEGVTRTAMIGAGDELFMVTEGQSLGGRYRVSAVGADVVELKDLATGATRRLALKSPASPL